MTSNFQRRIILIAIIRAPLSRILLSLISTQFLCPLSPLPLCLITPSPLWPPHHNWVPLFLQIQCIYLEALSSISELLKPGTHWRQSRLSPILSILLPTRSTLSLIWANLLPVLATSRQQLEFDFNSLSRSTLHTYIQLKFDSAALTK